MINTHSNFLVTPNSMRERHKWALHRMTDAYLFYLVSLHRRPVYRHQYGDISLNQPSVQGFIDSYLADKGWSVERRWYRYARILDLKGELERNNSDFIDWGTVPKLNPRGIKWLNACFWQLGEMVNEKGGWSYMVSYIDEWKAQNEV
ncbi:hypothetical protein GC087_06580 [Pantoea sp. JZ2]|uniref:hypothetical protein n=1 Tax=Pantoea sp. JZ2 TaxID=2654189 RepID=UPI002B47E0CD|nr:hypothetical protein [Pantoea sp. JZ2]WRH12301.1 hypothetical protein GC087_06580 [Pantoea sp. JZ2]